MEELLSSEDTVHGNSWWSWLWDEHLQARARVTLSTFVWRTCSRDDKNTGADSDRSCLVTSRWPREAAGDACQFLFRSIRKLYFVSVRELHAEFNIGTWSWSALHFRSFSTTMNTKKYKYTPFLVICGEICPLEHFRLSSCSLIFFCASWSSICSMSPGCETPPDPPSLLSFLVWTVFETSGADTDGAVTLRVKCLDWQCHWCDCEPGVDVLVMWRDVQGNVEVTTCQDKALEHVTFTVTWWPQTEDWRCVNASSRMREQWVWEEVWWMDRSPCISP